MTQGRQAIARMWSSWGGGLWSFAVHTRCGRGCRRSCGPQRRSWRGGTGSKLRRWRWMWIGRACRSGRIDSSLARKQSRASPDASVSLAEESPLPPHSWSCWLGPRRDGELSGGSRIAARCKAAAGVESHSNQHTDRVDSRFCGVVIMLQITPQMRILVAVEAVDFRKGIDSLAELCRAKLNADPFSGCLFVFRSRRATSIKVLVYDGQGFWLATKRLSKGRFRWWPQGEEPARSLRVHQAQVLLAAGNPDIDAAPVWRKV